MQETFLQAALSLERFEGRAKASTWLRAIALNLSRSHRRKASRSRLLDPEGLERVQEAASDAGSRAWNRSAPPSAATKPASCIERWTGCRRPYREVVTLRDLHGLSTREVAGRLGVAEGAVRVRLHRARRAAALLAPCIAEPAGN